MMNRSTQKELIKLMLQLNEMWPQLDLSNSEQQNMVLDILDTISAKCQKDFSKTNADWYVDTMESLGQVIKMTDWQNMGREELAQCVSLCQDIILKVINNLRNEKELKKDIVFLPYQASMWDSLESVWKAANEDKEHCNAYVIPIPYASLTPEHTAAEWHCERGLFPEYVPTLDWQTVDLEEMHPDVIFIHNPYDECNHVTSVESRYYSRNLKKCTDKLVYIPYSVEEEIQPGNEASENAIEHRVLLPVFFNADLIIAQSEEMRQAWINILMRRTNKKDRNYWEKRILGLGSPKIDKVLTSKKEDFDMPEQWKKLIKNKKVILYITSIGPMLQNADKVCDKLRYIFDTFRNRDDVVLWWRPHPLMRATFHSMRSQYEAEYLSLEKMYIEECWGIYDDSTDLHRAICWSDAYYGDYSSVMMLYGETRKPILRQALSDNDGIFLYYGKPATNGENLWYIPEMYPVIIELNLNSAEINNIFYLPIKNGYKSGLHGYRNLEKIGEKIYVIPVDYTELTNYIIEFDIKTHQFNKIDIPSDLFKNVGCAVKKISAFYYSNKKDNCIYLYGTNPYIVQYNVATKEYKVLFEWKNELIKRQKDFIFWNNGVFDNDTFVIPISQSSTILFFNVVSYQFKLLEINCNVGSDYEVLSIYNNTLWIMSNNSSYVIEYNLLNKCLREHRVLDNTMKSDVSWGKTSLIIGKQIWIFPYHAERCVIVELENCKIKEIDWLPHVSLKSIRNMFKANYPGGACKSDCMGIIIHSELKEIIYVQDNGEIECKTLKISDKYKRVNKYMLIDIIKILLSREENDEFEKEMRICGKEIINIVNAN